MDGAERQADPRWRFGAFVAGRVEWVQGRYLSSEGKQTGARMLAELRRAATQAPGACAATWSLEFEGFPSGPGLAGAGREPTRGEWAAHIALTLYAIHQQSQDSPMHAGEAGSLGAAVGRLVREGRKDGGRYANLQRGELPQRFAAVVSASSAEEVAHYLRQVVRLLRGASIQLDYGRLARDLYDLQDPLRADAVRLAWGRDYARQVETDKPEEAGASEAADL